MAITRDNHYLPELYLKHFTSASGHLYRYRILVPKPDVAEWKPATTGAVGYGLHLYTRALPDGDSDEIERWLNRDFETPATASISRAVSGQRLYPEDYKLLVRFLAAQIVRTPAFFVRNLPRWQREAENHIADIQKNLVCKLEEARISGRISKQSEPSVNARYLPYKVVQEPSDDGRTTLIRMQTSVGRGTWIFAMRHLLTDTLAKLTEHRWTIIKAHERLPWFTSDDPVLRLNFRAPQDYDFGGGWAVPNTNILLPLSPQFLLFTEVGSKAPMRGTVFPEQLSQLLRQYMAENAHRYIFSSNPDNDVSRFRPRIVNLRAFNEEKLLWNRWHAEQSLIEREFLQR